MREIDFINQIYDLKAKVIETDYILPPILTIIPNCNRINNNLKEEFEERQKILQEKAERLQKNEKERTQAIKEYLKRQAEAISKMSDRELLEAIYRRLNQ